MRKDRELNSTFVFRGQTFRVVASDSDNCSGCDLNISGNSCTKAPTGRCGRNRDDHQPVIFKIVTNDND